MKQIKLHIQLFNTIYKCAFCDLWFNALKSQCHALSKIEGVRPTQDGKTDVTLTISSVLICDDCFNNEKEDLELLTKPQANSPEIVLPK